MQYSTNNKFRLFTFIISLNLFLFSYAGEGKVTFLHHQDRQKIDIYLDGKYFTSYLYHDTLKKQVLYPIYSPGGNIITRGFPVNPRPNERVDHPHHIGQWFNYGNVNELDFWNNSYAVSSKNKARYGHIVHRKILKTKSDTNSGLLKVRCDWVNHEGKVILEETTTFLFSFNDSMRIIRRIAELKAVGCDVQFKDNKEGMFAIRMAREFEFPTSKPLILINDEGVKRKNTTICNDGRDGSYLSSTGLKDNNVWGTRAEWVTLSSEINGEQIAVTIMDHPSNIGHPTYWHARTYGLFSANPLGQKVFSNGEKTLDFRLNNTNTVTFQFQILISDKHMQTIDQTYTEFSESVPDDHF